MYQGDSNLKKIIKHFNNEKRRAHKRRVLKEAEKSLDPETVNGLDYEKKEDPWFWD